MTRLVDKAVIKNDYIIIIDGRTYDAFNLVENCVKEWDNFLRYI